MGQMFNMILSRPTT